MPKGTSKTFEPAPGDLVCLHESVGNSTMRLLEQRLTITSFLTANCKYYVFDRAATKLPRSLIEKAVSYHVTVVELSVVLKALHLNTDDHGLAPAGTTVASAVVREAPRESDRRIKHPHMFVHDESGRYQPLFKEFIPHASHKSSVPEAHLDAPEGISPFLPRSHWHKHRRSQLESGDRDSADEKSAAPNDGDASHDGDAQPAKHHHRHRQPGNGYCEWCCLRYTDFEMHCRTTVHMSYARDADTHFASLEQLMLSVGKLALPSADAPASTTSPVPHAEVVAAASKQPNDAADDQPTLDVQPPVEVHQPILREAESDAESGSDSDSAIPAMLVHRSSSPDLTAAMALAAVVRQNLQELQTPSSPSLPTPPPVTRHRKSRRQEQMAPPVLPTSATDAAPASPQFLPITRSLRNRTVTTRVSGVAVDIPTTTVSPPTVRARGRRARAPVAAAVAQAPQGPTVVSEVAQAAAPSTPLRRSARLSTSPPEQAHAALSEPEANFHGGPLSSAVAGADVPASQTVVSADASLAHSESEHVLAAVQPSAQTAVPAAPAPPSTPRYPLRRRLAGSSAQSTPVQLSELPLGTPSKRPRVSVLPTTSSVAAPVEAPPAADEPASLTSPVPAVGGNLPKSLLKHSSGLLSLRAKPPVLSAVSKRRGVASNDELEGEFQFTGTPPRSKLRGTVCAECKPPPHGAVMAQPEDVCVHFNDQHIQVCVQRLPGTCAEDARPKKDYKLMLQEHSMYVTSLFKKADRLPMSAVLEQLASLDAVTKAISKCCAQPLKDAQKATTKRKR